MQHENTILKLDLNLLIPNKYQPRKEFNELELQNLSESIKLYGILNPILAREKDGKYEIIAGERRFRASKMAGLTEVPVILKEATDEQMAELALIENIQRRELSPIEEAKSYNDIIKLSNQTQEEIAKKIGKSQSFIANKIRLLSLPKEIQEALADRKISERHARSLLTIDAEETQIEILNKIIAEKLTVKETEQLIHQKEITEDEIKQAINDIMKSLNITNIDEETEEKKEEKEDDNMNNGNFFPNYDSNNASLNMMNMQSMEPQNDIVMPTPPNIISTPMEPTPQVMEPQFQMGMTTPQMNVSQPVNVMPMDNTFNNQPTQESAPMMQETPLFNPNAFEVPATTAPVTPEPFTAPPMPEFISQPQTQAPMMNEPVQTQPEFVQPLVQPEIVQPTQESVPMMQETPLFNPNAFEVPVTPEPFTATPIEQTPIAPEFVGQPQVIEPVMNEPVTLTPVVETQNKLTTLKEFLNNNGYEYKVYTNENNNCVIIELPKN